MSKLLELFTAGLAREDVVVVDGSDALAAAVAPESGHGHDTITRRIERRYH